MDVRVFEPQGDAVAVHRQGHGPRHPAFGAGVDEAQEQRDEFGVVVDEVGEHARLGRGDRVGLDLLQLLQGAKVRPSASSRTACPNSMQVLCSVPVLTGRRGVR
ncbi:hypothetical protein SCALM49S_03275 [Streptomyces californicus]